MCNETLSKIKDGKIIAIVRGIPSDRIVNLAKALVDGGINCIEVTFDQSSEEKAKDTLIAISNIARELGERVCVGAGTVMTVEQVRQAAQAGAQYMISPNTDEAVIRETKRLGKVSIPGALTPTEAATAYAYGADIVKLFPAGLMGAQYIKAVKAPLKHIPVTAVGNVNVNNCAEFIKAGAIGVGVGGSLVSAELVNSGRFDEITAMAKEYVAALAGV
jgi:2-dehydro-3-deoxyphosphogluconate aldolase/(4S)-4-hydroxy-2-oxoglutarate aldolase